MRVKDELRVAVPVDDRRCDGVAEGDADTLGVGAPDRVTLEVAVVLLLAEPPCEPDLLGVNERV